MKRCECCDHPLEHLIACAIDRYNAPIPPPSYRDFVVMLKDGLDEWRETRDAG